MQAGNYRNQFLRILAQNEQRMTALFSGLTQAVAGDITRASDSEGSIPRAALYTLQRRAGDRVTALFLGRDADGGQAPFSILPDGRLYPLSPYMQALWAAIQGATRLPVEQSAASMRARLPADLLARFEHAQGDPFAVAKDMVREQAFRPNPLARYDAPHTWVDPNGYTLSDRIWNTAGATRRRLDAFLEDSINRGHGAARMARELEQFMLPGKTLQRTKAPYGTDASFDAMRLSRTEIARAHARASEMSANMNPFVIGLKWTLSRSHRKRDICDDHANGGPNGDGVYPLDNYPTMPAHPHDMCHWQNVMGDTRPVLDELREEIRAARLNLTQLIGPLLVEQFTDLLLRSPLSVARAAGA